MMIKLDSFMGGIEMKARSVPVLMTVLLLLMTACSNGEEAFKRDEKEGSAFEQPVVKSVDPESIEQISNEVEEEREEPIEREIVLSAVGDIMVHRTQLTRAYNPQSEEFDFTESFDQIKDYIMPHDYAIGNFETTLSGKDEGIRLENSQYYLGYQGYPTFNSPEILAKNIYNAGFDMMATANNHCFDGWTGGITNTIDTLDSVGLDHVGTYKHKDDERVFIKDIEGIKVAFFNYTYSTNGIIPPKDHEYMVNTFDNYDEAHMENMYDEVSTFITESKDVDLHVVSIHFGNEYYIHPNHYQKEISEELIRAGADVIIGSHPHVLQPLDIMEVELEDGSVREGLIIYSLGNFLSSQIYTNSDPVPKDAGVIMNMTINKSDQGTKVTKIGLVPTWVQWSKDFIRVIPVEKALSDYEQENMYGLTDKDYNRLLKVRDFTIPHLVSLLDVEPLQEEDEHIIDLTELLAD